MTDGEQAAAPHLSTSRSMVVYERQATSVGEARSWIDTFLAERAIMNPVRDDAQLVVSELVTNALMHGDGALVLRASITDSAVQLSVTDSGDALPEVLPLDPSRIGGLGLIVVDRLASDWGISPFPGGKTVWAALSLSS
jgi:anti-sigma regulatory factor (Ser/Thr protein kinase)